MTDPIADLLTRIRNATHARHESLLCPKSRIKVEILELLQREGFITGIEEIDYQGRKMRKSVKMIKVFPRYTPSNEAVLRGIQRVSKPSRRYYVGKSSIPRVRNGLGIAILTTAKGILTDKEARDKGVGGEVLCYVW